MYVPELFSQKLCVLFFFFSLSPGIGTTCISQENKLTFSQDVLHSWWVFSSKYNAILCTNSILPLTESCLIGTSLVEPWFVPTGIWDQNTKNVKSKILCYLKCAVDYFLLNLENNFFVSQCTATESPNVWCFTDRSKQNNKGTLLVCLRMAMTPNGGTDIRARVDPSKSSFTNPTYKFNMKSPGHFKTYQF